MTKKKSNDMIPVWGRVPYKHIEKIEKALPRYGWRARLIAHVMETLANELPAGSSPSMHTMESIADGATKKWAKQYAHGKKSGKS